ncbi:NUDIX domain-containing protein [Candidatus Shapirobacteria bacterium]|nr:NUDIX domain-containing protein [Candidatus Shapirobacteria bacterium]
MSKIHRVGAIIQNGKDIVLIHRVKNGEEYYAIPGGGIEVDEAPETALLREIKEELGLKIDSYSFVKAVDSPNRHDYYFHCTTKDTEFVVTGPEKKYLNIPEKLFEPKWVNKDNLNKNLKIYPENGRDLIINILK